MPALRESTAKAVQNEKATMEAFQVLERLRLLALHVGFTGRIAVEVNVEDGVLVGIREIYERKVI